MSVNHSSSLKDPPTQSMHALPRNMNEPEHDKNNEFRQDKTSVYQQLHKRLFLGNSLKLPCGGDSFLMSSNNIGFYGEMNKMSFVLRKPVFGISDQVPHKPGCTAT